MNTSSLVTEPGFLLIIISAALLVVIIPTALIIMTMFAVNVLKHLYSKTECLNSTAYEL